MVEALMAQNLYPLKNILSDAFLILKFQSYMQAALHILLITEESFYTFRYSNL